MGKDREKVDGVAKSIIFVSSDSKQVSNYGIVNCQRRGLGAGCLGDPGELALNECIK